MKIFYQDCLDYAGANNSVCTRCDPTHPPFASTTSMMTSSQSFYNSVNRIDGCLAADCTNVDAMRTMTCDKLLDICSPVTSVSIFIKNII